MTRTVVTRAIRAPTETVFRTVADISEFSKVVDKIVHVEFLTEQKYGLGTRFRETRMMNGKEAATELEVTEFAENDHIRLVADSHGSIWDSIFTVRPTGDAVELKLVMEGRAYKLLPRIMNPLIKGIIQKAVEGDMDAVKAWCEGGSDEVMETAG